MDNLLVEIISKLKNQIQIPSFKKELKKKRIKDFFNNIFFMYQANSPYRSNLAKQTK